MTFLFVIAPALYHDIYLIIILSVSILTFFSYLSTTRDNVIQCPSNIKLNFILAFLFAVIVAYFLGTRPISGVFVDTGMYVHTFNSLNGYPPISLSSEWLWEYFTLFIRDLGFSANDYLLIIECIYVGGMFICCLILMENNTWFAFLICAVSFSFYGYAVNGLRNGVACSIVMSAIALLCEGGKKKYIAFILMFIAMAMHRSTALPSLSALLGFYFIKEPRKVIIFWGLSIIISFFAGDVISSFFVNIGFDERLENYLIIDDTVDIENMSTDIAPGFRVDFIIYSSIPILFTWYLTFRRQFNDKVFNVLATTYILSNSFWIMVIRAEFSNRFAYLSWFLYPIIIAYPLIRFNIWDNQNRKAALILLAYAGFTAFMSFIYYA